MLQNEDITNELDRTTIVAIARDCTTKSAFIFNSSAGLREPTNEYKYLLEFFEITLRDITGLVSLNGEYDFGGFSYKIYEELPYANHNNRDQEAINEVKKKYIDEYNDNEKYPLYNRTLNDNAKTKLKERQHNGNIIKLYNELHFKRLKEYYEGLNEIIDYDTISAYLKSDKRISPEVKTNDISRSYFKGDLDAGIELILRKMEDEMLFKLAGCSHIKELKNDFDHLLNAYKIVMHVEDSSKFDFDTNLLATQLYNDYYYDISPILTLLAEKAQEKIKGYFDGKDSTELIVRLNGKSSWIRQRTKEGLMKDYIEETDTTYKKLYLYALYEQQNNSNK